MTAAPLPPPRIPSHTYTTAGTYNAKVTVSDGEDSVTRTVVVNVFGADERRRPVPRARLLQDDGLPPRLDPGGHRRDQEARSRTTTSRSTRPRTRPRSSPTPSWPTTTPWSSSRPRATRSTTPSRRRSSATSAVAAATWASTPRPTPSTRGPGTASWWARTSATTRPARRPPTVHVEDTDHHSTTGLPNPLAARGRVVQLPAPEGAVVGGGGTDWSPRAGRRARARHGRRVDLRRGRRQHDG